ncbi:hypothetical protein FE772_00145 [Lysobacter enzymogenes]|nr:hypothetical protein FE772_00145 [Lysobacter enzymogenes]
MQIGEGGGRDQDDQQQESLHARHSGRSGGAHFRGSLARWRDSKVISGPRRESTAPAPHRADAAGAAGTAGLATTPEAPSPATVADTERPARAGDRAANRNVAAPVPAADTARRRPHRSPSLTVECGAARIADATAFAARRRR